MRTVTAKGPTVEQAIQNALNEMNTTKDNVTIRILEEPQDKISGDFTSKYAKVEVTLNEGEIDIIKQFLNDIFKAMNLKVDIHAHYDEEMCIRDSTITAHPQSHWPYIFPHAHFAQPVSDTEKCNPFSLQSCQ